MKKLLIVVLVMWVSSGASAGGGSSVGPANPAAAFCVGKGGQYVLNTSLCQFGRGIIDAWTLFREGKSGLKQLAVDAYFRRGNEPEPAEINAPNPAAVYCVNHGGTLEYPTAGGQQWGVCRFSDNSSIEEWTLLRGPESEVNQQLTAVLEAF